MCLAIPGKVLSIREPESADGVLDRIGIVDFGGVQKEVNLSLVPEATVGNYVVVHVGFAISTMDEAEANEVFEYLRQMEEADEAAPATS